MQAQAATSGDNEAPVNDLGPLAWVLEELRKSLDGATKAIRRFVRDAELARGSDLESLDASQLRIARQQLHQAVGALEMVGLPEPAKVLRAMESLAQKFVQRPEFCSEEAASKVERASFALVEYLEGVLRGKSASAVALFPQYRDVLELVGDDRIHPAELWPLEWRWIDMALPDTKEPLAFEPAVRARMDSNVLRLVKTGSVSASKDMREISLGLAAAQKTLESRVLWKISAAYFEALSLKLLPLDVYVKRAASRILMQYSTLARGNPDVSDRLAQDLLFFCAQAVPPSVKEAPVLTAVRLAYGLTQTRAVNYDATQFGRFDPAVLVQARKRIATATETWSALSGGDTNRLKVVADQFALVSESLLKLHPENSELVRMLVKAVDVTVRSGEPPSTPVAMEVATAILYLDAAYEDLDPTESNMRERSQRLAARLERVLAGGDPEPLESWMEELYRRVSDRQTMGSVVEELRTTLTEIEKALDQFFRNPKDKQPLHEVPSELAQMRGVFSVLGLDQASLATVRMRDTVEKFLVDNIDEASARSGVFEKFGNSLGALGFLIDMLSYQRALAKKLFVYDEELGEFKPLMGRERDVAAAAPEPIAPPARAGVPSRPAPLAPIASKPASASAAPAPAPAPSPLADMGEDDGAELRDIFLEEAREVVVNGQAALDALASDPSDLGHQTTLRRAFHTLKGSSRMVSFNEFGEAAWAMEQMMNSWLAEQKPAQPELLELAGAALQGLGRWVEDIASGQDALWSAAPFRLSADAMRLDTKFVPLELPAPQASEGGLESLSLSMDLPDLDFPAIASAPAERSPRADAPPVDFAATQMFDFELSPAPTTKLRQEPSASAGLSPASGDMGDIDFSSLANVPPVASRDPFVLDTAQSDPPDWATMSLEKESDTPPKSSLPEPKSPKWTDTTSGSIDNLPEVTEQLSSGLEAFDFELSDSVDVSSADEQVKVIGTLRIGIPLYNVFLNEADEWSRRLLTELNEWALELHHPVPDSSIALAHSLGGSSATVGFKSLSEIARALEQAMQHVQLHGQGLPEHAQVFISAAEEVRHLLHQFAAGFLKPSESGLIEALQVIVGTEFAPIEVDPESYMPDVEPVIDLDDLSFDFSSPPPAASAPPPQAPALPVKATVPVRPAVVPDPAPAQAAAPASAPALRGAARLVLDDEDDEIDAVDAIDQDLFPIFEEEAAELLPQLASALRQWAEQPDDTEARLDVLRVLHTLKGSARLAGAMRLGEMAHRMESAIEQMGTEFLQSAQIEPMLTRFDRLQQIFDELSRGPAEVAEPLPVAVPRPRAVASAPVAPLTAPAPLMPAAARAVTAVPVVPAKPMAMAASPALKPHATMPATRRSSAQTPGQTVRVRSHLLDRLVNQAGEVMITRSRLDARLGQLNGSLNELTTNLDRLRTHLRDVEVQAESQMQSRLAQTKDLAQGFDPLEFDRFTRVQELTRMMAESVNDVATVQRNLQQTISGTEDDLIAQGRQARELQRDLLRTRMMEFEGISERLYGVVRQASKDAGKQVKLDIVGGSMEIDRGVLDRMAPAFEHMLRNSVAHGIETPEQREATGKSASGTITIGLSHEGNDVSVTFSDDGAGLNLPRIREKAQSQGLLAPGALMTDSDAANMIFMPGFSTAASVTELSGRGIGMDVVRAEVQSLGGRIETQTQAGVGTSFKLVLPLTTAVTQVIMLRMGELNIGVPANLVEIVRRLPRADLEQSYRSGTLDYAGEVVPFFWSGALLQASTRSREQGGKTQPVVLMRSAGQRLAVHVDEVLGNQEVVVKNLGPQLSRLPGLAGMSVLASGAVVLIYNPVALATVYGEKAHELQIASTKQGADALTMASAPKVEKQMMNVTSELPLILVVDDSITVRRVTQRLLRREGYRVALAADGLQALERLAEEKPAVVLSDIEMPRMDGFDLARNIRADAKLRDLPIIMITSRIAEKHREHARTLGVNNYLGKPYSEDELLSLVQQYCTQTSNV